MIYNAKVVSTETNQNECVFWCIVESIQLGPIPVHYTSPFYRSYNGGIFAMPEPSTEVLIYSTPENKYYYLCTVVNPTPLEELLRGYTKHIPDTLKAVADKYIFTEYKVPQRLTFTDSFGQGLHIDSRNLPKYISSKVQLKSRGGKILNLSDSPKSDAIQLITEHGDGLTITSQNKGKPRKDNYRGLRSVELKSLGSSNIVSYESEINLIISDGRDINIENHSSTKNGREDGTQSGNINIRSKNSDVSIVTEGDTSKIFIVTPKARIQIDENGNVLFETSGSIQMVSKSDIVLKADNAIHIEASDINIKSSGDIKAQAGSTMNLLSSGQSAIQGSEVHLNSSPASPAEDATILQLGKTDYEE